jgi:dolichyl-diphosphooligosaccharide--protein glycosyltransferase
MWSRLHERLGSRGEGVAGLGRYRALYASGDGSVAAFRLVPGAILAGQAAPNATVRATTSVRLPPANRTLAYERRTRATPDGWFAVRVAHRGEYRVGGRTVSVGPRAVREGLVVPVPAPTNGPGVSNGTGDGAGDEDGPGDDGDDTDTASSADGRTPTDGVSGSHWPLEAGRGDYAFDVRGGHHAEVVGARRETDARWVGTGARTALATDGRAWAVVPGRATGDGRSTADGSDRDSLDGSDGFTLSVRFRVADRQSTRFPRLVAKANASRYRSADGYQLALQSGRLLATVGNGTDVAVLRGPEVADGRWHRAALSWNGTAAVLRLDSRRVATATVRGDPATRAPLAFGAAPGGGFGFRGRLDDVRFVPEAVVRPSTDETRSVARDRDDDRTGDRGRVAPRELMRPRSEIPPSMRSGSIGTTGAADGDRGTRAAVRRASLGSPTPGSDDRHVPVTSRGVER